MSDRPKSVRINGETFAIRYRRFTKKEEAVGQCLYDKSLIEVDPRQTHVNLRDTVLHEILHAVLAKQGHTGSCFSDNETEERYVSALATGLAGVFQDNPDLACWLIEQE
jgi:hypothetical protein